MPDVVVQIPHNYLERAYQKPFWQAMFKGKKRAALIWHRRAGKGKTVLNFTIDQALNERVGAYYHCFPEYNQGRKILWDGMDREGFRFMDHFPEPVVKARNSTELKITLVNGSIWQIIGADSYDSLVGPNPVGIVFDEWAVSDNYPKAWDYFRPILVENGGWAVFVYTPRGRNHGFTLYQMALNNEDWYCQRLTVDDTGAISKADIEAERQAGMSDEMIQQEFYCSFLASTEDIVIPFELIQGALTRDARYPRSPKIAGLDVARFGNDRTALIVRQAGEIIHAETWGKTAVDQSAARALDRFRAGLFDAVAVDSIGIGAGVADILRANDVPTAMVQVSEKPINGERFSDHRSELWWRLREWFEEGACSIPMTLPPAMRDAIIKDIQDIHYKYSPTNKIQIETKDDMKKRLGFSPDLGDALCLTFTPKITLRAKTMAGGKESGGFSNWKQGHSQRKSTYEEVYI
jgi:hypothetical protein